MATPRIFLVPLLPLVTLGCDGGENLPDPERSALSFAFVFHDGEKFVATGVDGYATSSDGDTFSLVPHLDDIPVWSIAGPPTSLVAVGGYYLEEEDLPTVSKVNLSSDGKAWIATPPPTQDIIYSIAYGAGTFVAMAWSTPSVLALRSRDALTWSVVDLGQRGFSPSPEVAYLGDRFVAWDVGPDILESTDGVEWTAFDTGLTQIDAISTYGDGLVGIGTYDCCMGKEPEVITRVALRWTATDGWTAIERNQESRRPRDLLAIGDRVILVGDGIRLAEGEPDSWRWQTVVSDGDFYAVAYDGADTLVAANASGETSLVSHDRGLTWASVVLQSE